MIKLINKFNNWVDYQHPMTTFILYYIVYTPIALFVFLFSLSGLSRLLSEKPKESATVTRIEWCIDQCIDEIEKELKNVQK